MSSAVCEVNERPVRGGEGAGAPVPLEGPLTSGVSSAQGDALIAAHSPVTLRLPAWPAPLTGALEVYERCVLCVCCVCVCVCVCVCCVCVCVCVPTALWCRSAGGCFCELTHTHNTHTHTHNTHSLTHTHSHTHTTL